VNMSNLRVGLCEHNKGPLCSIKAGYFMASSVNTHFSRNTCTVELNSR
jgi:hypothetical protein